ncbi:MAG: PAS domain-containing sensor histidine kinase [Maricaulaceae bacterium]|nr:PAS domain-containing sensor histidine kinase [Maricaulaceae bacterium]
MQQNEPSSVQPDGRASSLFLTAGFALAVLVVAGAAFLTIAGAPAMAPGEPLLTILLLVNLGLILALAIVVGLKVARRFFDRRSGQPAPRLHLRFLAMFSIAAATPVVLVAVFLGGVLTRGVDYWFGERVSAVVDSAAAVARELVETRSSEALEQVGLMAFDLSDPGAVEGFASSRIQYVQYFRRQALARDFAAAYIVDRHGAVLARAEFRGEDEYIPPSERLYQLADSGDLGVSTPETADDGVMRALYRLTAYDDAFLYVYLGVDYQILRRAEEAVVSYREAREREGQSRAFFILVYLEAAALVLLGAIWIAMSAATRIVRPVSNLVAAAERVRRGDLDARVEVRREDDEIGALGRAFNRMTRQLRGQRRELIASHAQSERRRAFTEAVLSGVSAGVIGIDEDGRITLVNRSAAALLQHDETELVGMRFVDAAPALEATAAEARRRPGEEAEAQTDLVREDGGTVNLSVRAVLDADAGLVLTFDDVTRLVAAQRNAAWRDVARRIAHEIKNPLTPIQLSAERLRRKYGKLAAEHDPETFERCTETIIRQVSDIGRMVDEFSSFARMPTPLVGPVEMGELVQETIFAHRVASPEIRFDYRRPEDAVIARCDPRLAAQALANILKNAGESVTARSDSEGAKAGAGLIVVSLSTVDGLACIEVTDNGLGWPTPDRNRLTEPYMTTREKGTGLGLAIVKRVMEDHGGRLELDTPPDGAQGAVVRLCFPLAAAEDISAAASADAVEN